MKTKKNWKTTFINISSITVLGIFLMFVFGTNSNLSKGVTANKILQIETGMTEEMVKSILGNPFEIKSENNKNEITYYYSKPVMLSKNYPMLWVHFNQDLKVREVYAKRYIYFGADDEGIYALAKSKSINKDLFYKCFP